MKRKILAGLLTLCMAAGMAVPAAAATTPAEQEPGADGPKYTHVDHVLNEDTPSTNMDILVMPGESFTAQPNIDIHKGNCACITADYQYWKYVTTVQFMNADLYLGYVNIPNYSAHEPRYVSDGYLTTSTPDLSKLEPITKYYDNAIKIAYENKLLEIDPSAYGEEEYSNLQSALEAACELPGHTFNAGYVNNTGLPMLLTACYAGGKGAEGEKVGTEGCGHVGHGPVRSMYGGGFSEFYVTFYEPYYNINYEGVENYFTEEELADLPDRYYIQREEQQIVLPNPVRPGYHFKNWRESGYDTIIGSGETKTVKDGKTFITFDFENSLRYGAGDLNLAPIFTRGCTVTFNPNGGALKDGEKAIREIDLKSVENGQFFDIGGVIPVREGYTFAGWSFSPSGERNSIIANTANSDWFADWESYYRSLQYGENPASTSIYDIQLYAVWEKNVTELTNSDTNVSISLTDGVPEDATLSADTIAQESVLGSRPELKEELPGLLSIYDISVRQNGETLEIKDNPMTVKIPLNDHLKGYKYYQAVYLGDPLERFDAVVEGDFLVFETDHLSQYAILGSNTPFETSEKPTDPDELPFQDVRNGDWFYDSAKYVYEKGIMTGINDTTFAPYEALARAQFAVILHRLNGEPQMEYTDRFHDVGADIWYTDAILWAADADVVTGYSNGNFGPADKINREQMATMMYRYAQYKGYSLEGGVDYSQYEDAANVSDFAQEAMSWAVGNGIITGKYGETQLDPQGEASRAESATIIMRFIETFGE